MYENVLRGRKIFLFGEDKRNWTNFITLPEIPNYVYKYPL